jgi:hypothetical protein
MIYLYKKTHKVTGLKYLGKTIQDPYKYTGSGVYWERHLKTHGNEVETEILFEAATEEEIKEKGIYYSELWNIVESDEWANLKPETGDGGSGEMTDDTKEKIRRYQREEKIWTELALENRLKNMLDAASNRKGNKNPQHSKFMSSMIRTEESNKKRSLALSGRRTSKGREGHVYPDEKKITCDYCGKRTLPGYFKRYHGNNCKLNTLP